MKKYGFVLLVVVGVIAVVTMRACSPQSTTTTAMVDGSDDHSEVSHPGIGMISGRIVETMDSGGYTYALVDTGTDRVWTAGPKTKVDVGAVVSCAAEMEMRGFKSETLDRTFDKIFFVNSLDTDDETARRTPQAGMPSGHPPVTPPDSEVDFSGINVPEGGQTIASLYAEKKEIVGRKVTVRGKVTKFVSGVMGKNWLHIGDGSATGKTGDLTVTTQAVVKIGDVVVVRGILSAERDFGFGYQYEIMVEDAEVTVE